nr:hypothetical protein [Leptolyngbya sp. Prado105]
MFQDSSIEEMPILLDRVSDSASDFLQDAEIWRDHQMPALENPLRNGDPDSDRTLQSFSKPVEQPEQSNRKIPLRCLQAFSFSHAVRRIVFHPDEEMLLTVGSPTRGSLSEVTNTVRAWNWRTGNPIFSLKGHRAPIRAIALSQDGYTLVTGSDDRTIKVWNVRTGEELTTLNGQRSPVSAIAISADGQTVVSSGCNQYELRDRQARWTVRDRALRIWKLPQGEITHLLPCVSDAPILSMRGKALLKIERRPEVISLQTGETRLHLNWLTACEQWLAMTSD